MNTPTTNMSVASARIHVAMIVSMCQKKSMSAPYVLPGPKVLSHGGPAPVCLGDYDMTYTRSEFTADDALAASGDCFVAFATRLDKLAQRLPQDCAEQIELEHIITSMLYLQDNYLVVAKRKSI